MPANACSFDGFTVSPDDIKMTIDENGNPGKQNDGQEGIELHDRYKYLTK